MSAIQNISLYIPHVYANFTSSRVFDIIENMNIGDVKRVDFVPKNGSDGKPYNAAYIHFYQWYDNIVARNFQERVLNPAQEARIMYDDPWYWLVLENKGKKHVPGERKPRIDLDAFSTPEKPVTPVLNLNPPKVQRAPKTKSWAQVTKPPGPLNLGNDFDGEAQAADNKITQEEMDWAYEQMENAEMIAEMEADIQDRHYVESLEEENSALRSQLAYFQNLYYTETIKSQTLADTIKHIKE